MSIIGVIVILVIAGVGLWLLNSYVPMAQPIRTIVNVLVVLVVIVWLLQILGVFSGGPVLRR